MNPFIYTCLAIIFVWWLPMLLIAALASSREDALSEFRPMDLIRMIARIEDEGTKRALADRVVTAVLQEDTFVLRQIEARAHVVLMQQKQKEGKST